MPIAFTRAVTIDRAPEHVWAIIDDPTRTPEWLARCTGMEALTPGPPAVGTKLRYSFKDCGMKGVMDGEVTARVANEHLALRFDDRMMIANIDFRVRAEGAGTRLEHTVELTPRTVVTKLFSPLIRRRMPQQTVAAMETLKALAQG